MASLAPTNSFVHQTLLICFWIANPNSYISIPVVLSLPTFCMTIIWATMIVIVICHFHLISHHMPEEPHLHFSSLLSPEYMSHHFRTCHRPPSTNHGPHSNSLNNKKISLIKHLRALASGNFNSTLFYHSKKLLYHYTIPFYNTFTSQTFISLFYSLK